MSSQDVQAGLPKSFTSDQVEEILTENKHLKSENTSLKEEVCKLKQELQKLKPSRAPPRRLRMPWEILQLVFEFADVPTLAVLGRVSYDVLACTSSLLYRDVQLKSFEALKQLFYRRNDNVIPISQTTGIYSYLSLSQIKTLSLDFRSLSASKWNRHRHPTLSLSRMAGSYQDWLLLDRFQLITRHKHLKGARRVLELILPLLNPVKAQYEFTARPVDAPIACRYDLPPFVRSGWNRIEVVEMKGSLVLWMEPGGRIAISHATPRPIFLRLHVATLLPGGDLSKLFESLGEAWGFDDLQPGHLILVVRTGEEKKEVELGVRGLDAAMRALISLELEA